MGHLGKNPDRFGIQIVNHWNPDIFGNHRFFTSSDPHFGNHRFAAQRCSIDLPRFPVGSASPASPGPRGSPGSVARTAAAPATRRALKHHRRIYMKNGGVSEKSSLEYLYKMYICVYIYIYTCIYIHMCIYIYILYTMYVYKLGTRKKMASTSSNIFHHFPVFWQNGAISCKIWGSLTRFYRGTPTGGSRSWDRRVGGVASWVASQMGLQPLKHLNWLVVGPPLWKYEFVNWDDNRNPILMGK